MPTSETDSRSPNRRALDEAIAGEPPLRPLDLAPDAVPAPVEVFAGRTRRHPLALAGIVENGLVRLLDPAMKLPEHSRVIVVAEGA
jgi:hypothetical protein